MRTIGGVIKHKRKLLLMVAVVIVSGAVAAAAEPPPMPETVPTPTLPSPSPAYTLAELEELKLLAMNTAMRLVVMGTELEVPDDAVVDSLQAKSGQQNQEALATVARIVAERISQTPAGETAPVYAVRPLPLPVYMVVRDGEMASVSKSTGEFMVGEEHQETFQFLIDQLGQENMRLLVSEVYETLWGPFRGEEGE